MKHLFVILSLVCLFSCQSKKEKFIQSEFSKIQARWLIDFYDISSTYISTNDVKMKFKTGEILFKQCKYTDKDFAVSGRSCGGDFDINGFIYGVSYTYNYSSGRYLMSLSGPVGSRDETVVDAMYGEWTLSVIDNKLIAKQVKNLGNQSVLISFTATKK